MRILVALAFVLAAARAKSLSAAQPLDYMVIEVNKQSRIVRSGEALTAIVGDVLTVKSAHLIGGGEPRFVNVIGFELSGPDGPKDERNHAINTAKDLETRFSHDKKGEFYDVTTKTGGHLLGKVRLRLKVPELRYAVCRINGKDQILRAGELLKVKKSDTFKLKEVVSNLEELSDEVTFEIVPVGGFKEIPGVEFHEIRFNRAGSTFARIPLQIEGT